MKLQTAAFRAFQARQLFFKALVIQSRENSHLPCKTVSNGPFCEQLIGAEADPPQMQDEPLGGYASYRRT